MSSETLQSETLQMDITFLASSPASSEMTQGIQRLRDFALESGLVARVSTNPLELARIRPATDLTVAVIDGQGHADYDVLALVAVLRTLHKMAIIMLVPDEAVARSEALLAGADICLSCPVDTDEFHAALHAVARRTVVEPRLPRAETVRDYTEFAAAEADRAWRLIGKGWTLLSPKGTRVNLTATESRLLQYLFQAPGAVVSDEDLAKGSAVTAGPGREHRQTPLAAIVCRLRKKCRDMDVTVPIISSRGQGYRFAGDCVIDE